MRRWLTVHGSISGGSNGRGEAGGRGPGGGVVGAWLWVELDSAVWRGDAEVPSRWVMVRARSDRGPTRSEQESGAWLTGLPPTPSPFNFVVTAAAAAAAAVYPSARVSPPWPGCSHSRWAFEGRSDADWVNGLCHLRALCLVPDRRCCAAEGKTVGGSERCRGSRWKSRSQKNSLVPGVPNQS